ncbi:MAG TPA: DNA methylase [Pseudomonadota bacterium]|nr:DNA methylase [Pseudomonadota bacterium]
MDLRWHSYRYYPYEKDLALREIQALLSPRSVAAASHGVRVEGHVDPDAAERLVYFAQATEEGRAVELLQSRLERASGSGASRQATRYSVHGLHEYKGKFNPQIARAILNIFNIFKISQASAGARVLDPFCGSGTSLVECAHVGISAVGLDINPLAVFLANAKLQALRLPVAQLQEALTAAVARFNAATPSRDSTADERLLYLRDWFEPQILDGLERLRAAISRGDSRCAQVLISVASNLLREYSLQDPNDLRIRRRKTPLPETAFIAAFEQAAALFITRLAGARSVLGTEPAAGRAVLADSRDIGPGCAGLEGERFDCALTSPPYATALPYIDTQRLSLVWLGLLAPADILRMEATLVGSREVRGESKKNLLTDLLDNRSALPAAQADYCQRLQAALSSRDGFRRQAVPLLLYRYFAAMASAFRSVRACMKDAAPFALIVGSNHTVLSGQRFDIDTPHHLAQLAIACGWTHEETVPLQTYQRYGYHMSNAVASEGLLLLRAA